MKRYGLLIALLALPGLLFAQAAGKAQTAKTPTAIIAYADDPGAAIIVDKAGTGRAPSIGDELAVGETLKSGGTTVELQLEPNGSIIKVAKHTVFRLDSLQGKLGGKDNSFALLSGKIRTVAAKASKGNKYRFSTPTSVCGVRGTDFVLMFQEGARDAVFVTEGIVDFARSDAAGNLLESVRVGAGQFADTLAASFQPAPFSPADHPDVFDADAEFSELRPGDVGAEQAPGVQENAEVPGASVSGEATPKGGATESPVLSWLRNNMGFEMGSVTINGTTYSKAILQPTIQAGKLRMSLYLPAVYTNDLFSPASWYRPGGNNEWSFGFDKGWNAEHWTEALADAATDLALKIRYLEYGRQYVDPFFVKLGNLEDMTLGHGVLMRNFANDADFPTVRRIGLDTGLDFGSSGFEAVVNDLSGPDILGTRWYARPFKGAGLAFGISAVADLNPMKEVKASTSAASALLGDPVLLGSAVDVEFAFARSDPFSLILFGDVAGLMPWTRTDITYAGGTIPAGAQWNALWNSATNSPRNWGLVSGFIGNIFLFDWRLEFRDCYGVFKPGIFDGLYERNRAYYAQKYYDYLTGAIQDDDKASILGIYGEGGFSILDKKLSFSAGYLWPFSTDPSVTFMDTAKNDSLVLTLALKRGLIPGFAISGAFSYERKGFAYALMADRPAGVGLFDENTVLSGEVAYPVAPVIDLALKASTAVKRDSGGNVLATDGNPYTDAKTQTPAIVPVFSLETRVHF